MTGFVLVDAATNTDIGPLRNDDALDLRSLPAQVSVQAVVSGTLSSVRFGYDEAALRTGNAAPYSLSGDDAGDYAPFAFTGGQHTLTATPFAAADAGGAAGGAMSIKFFVVSRD